MHMDLLQILVMVMIHYVVNVVDIYQVRFLFRNRNLF
jgi:hypothetical protein